MEQTNVVPTRSKQTRTVALQFWFKSKTCGFFQVLECSSGFLCPLRLVPQSQVGPSIALFGPNRRVAGPDCMVSGPDCYVARVVQHAPF